MLYITSEGRLKYKSDIEENHEAYLRAFTTYDALPDDFLTPNFRRYLEKRNEVLDENLYSFIE